MPSEEAQPLSLRQKPNKFEFKRDLRRWSRISTVFFSNRGDEMRLFLGIGFSDQIKFKINEVEEAVKTKIISGSPVPLENHHITIHFLGSIEE